MTSSSPYYVGVDVGTSSVRAALVDSAGKVISTSTHPIKIYEPQPDFYEQSSENIWMACCKTIRSVANAVDSSEIHGLGFDATCSLVVLDNNYRPISVSPSQDPDCNVILWMDHRAMDQTERINNTQHRVLRNVGGKLTVEWETPKLLWLKENLNKECWQQAGHFMELPDFLT